MYSSLSTGDIVKTRIILEQLEQGIAKSYKLRKLESLILKIFFTIFTIFFFLIFHSCFKLNS